MNYFVRTAKIENNFIKDEWHDITEYINRNATLNLFRSTTNNGFYIEIGCKEDADIQLYKRFKPEVDLNNPYCINDPVQVSFSRNGNTLDISCEGDWAEDRNESLTEMTDIQLSELYDYSDVLFIIDGTMLKKIVFKEDSKQAQSEADSDIITIVPKIINCVIDALNDVARPIQSDSNRYGVVLFGEYDTSTHPINNFDLPDYPLYAAKDGISGDVLDDSNTFYFESDKEKAKAAIEAIFNNVDNYFVDGGDFEDCLEYALEKANRAQWQNQNRLIFIFTASPPHPHISDNSYKSDQYHIFKTNAIDWKEELSKLENKGVHIYTYYSYSEGLRQLLGKEIDQYEALWKKMGKSGLNKKLDEIDADDRITFLGKLRKRISINEAILLPFIDELPPLTKL